MPKLHQLLSVASGKKSRAQSELTKAHHMVQKEELTKGMIRTYQPKDDDGDVLPQEIKRVQYTAAEAITTAQTALADMFDIVGTIDRTNCHARADVVVNGLIIIEEVPPTHLIFLEKQLTDLRTFVEKLPTLDPAQEWEFNGTSDSYRSAEYQTTRTRKVPRNHVKAEATENHPAQVEVYMEDIIVGTWTQVHFSGAIPAKQRREILERINTLQEAVKFAREEANSTDAVELKTGKAVLDFVFTGTNDAS